MFKIYIKTSTLFLVILVGLTAAWLVFNAFKFFKNFPLIFTIKKHTKKTTNKAKLSLFSDSRFLTNLMKRARRICVILFCLI